VIIRFVLIQEGS